MSGRKRRAPVVGLVRHRLTEAVESSVATVFSTIERATARHFPVRGIPAWTESLPPPHRDRGWQEFLAGCDLLVTPSPGFVHRFRDEGGLSFRMVMTPLGSFPRGALNFRRAARHTRGGDLIVFSSQADRAIFNHLFARCPADQRVIPFPVDQRKFRPLPPRRRAELRRQFGFQENDVVFLYVGRITAEKNVHAALALFDALVARQPQARFLVVGRINDQKFREFDTGPYDLEEIFRQIIANSPRLEQRVSLLPWIHRDVLPGIYGIADVFLNLTLHHDENFGYGQIEAMSCGLPVVGTDWGGLKDTITDEVTGFRIPTFVSGRGVQLDRFRAMEACLALVTSPALRRSLGEAGRARAGIEYGAPLFERRWTEALTHAARAVATDGETELSDFGRSFDQAFSGRQPLYGAETYALYQELILPYSSGRADRQAGDVFFLQPVSFELTGETIEVRDPLWPGIYPVDGVQHRIVAALEQHELETASPFLDRKALEAVLPDVPRPVLERAVVGLVEQGILGRSGAASQAANRGRNSLEVRNA